VGGVLVLSGVSACDTPMTENGEKRAVDHAQDARAIAGEAAFYAEYIQEQKPEATRDEQFDLLVDLIDEVHGEAHKAEEMLND